MNLIRRPPIPDHRMALFLDFDGTLVHFAQRPDQIVVPRCLPALLQELSDLLGGALALVSGRSIANIDRHLGQAGFAIAGEHGGQWRLAGGDIQQRPAAAYADLLSRTEMQFGSRDGVVIEPKSAGFAVHYRLEPKAEGEVANWMRELIEHRSDLELIQGKLVCELRSAGVSKAVAIDAFMRTEPFAGRVPVFAGDDITDEEGFAAVNSHGGISIKVGDGETAANFRISDVDEVISWLREAANRMELANQKVENRGP